MMQAKFLFAAFLLFDLVFSAFQYGGMGLDGDLAAIALPAPHYTQVVNDPLGWQAICNGELYAGAGRPFAHLWVSTYFQEVPRFFRLFMNPIDSLYLAATLFRWVAHWLLVVLIVACVRPSQRSSLWDYIFGWAISTAFIQSGGFHGQMGLIDSSISYTGFYAWPMIGLLWWWRPYLHAWLHGREARLHSHQLVFRLLAVWPLAASGPLISPVLLVLVAALVIMALMKEVGRGDGYPDMAKIWRYVRYYWPILVFVVAGLYAVYLSQYNSESYPIGHSPSLLSRYSRLLEGLINQLSLRLGLPLSVSVAVLLYYLAGKWLKGRQRRDIRQAFALFILFAGLYLVLLPLGGTRSYRQFIIRYDTQMPITLGLVLLLVGTAWRLWYRAPLAWLTTVRIAWVAFLILLVNADLRIDDEQSCERRALHLLQDCPPDADVCVLPRECHLLGWGYFDDRDQSWYSSQMLMRWGITERVKRYRHEAE